MLLSIIIPSFNSESTIRSTLDSIFLQTYSDFEVLIIDNNSTDETSSIADEYRTSIRNFKFFSSNDKGIYDAMNKGIKLAKGEWLYFMGADDSFYDNQVLSNLSVFLSKSFEIVYGDSMWVPDMVKEEGEWTNKKILFQSINHQRIFYKKTLFSDSVKYNIKYKISADHALNIYFFCSPFIKKIYVPILIAKFNTRGFSWNKLDVNLWEDWDLSFYANFKGLLPSKLIYSSLGIYCRHLIDKKYYLKAIAITIKVLVNTFNVGFVLLMIRYFLRKKTIDDKN